MTQTKQTDEPKNDTYPSAEHDLSKERSLGVILPSDHGVGVRPVVEVVVEDGVAEVDQGGAPADHGPSPGFALDQAVGAGHEHGGHRG